MHPYSSTKEEEEELPSTAASSQNPHPQIQIARQPKNSKLPPIEKEEVFNQRNFYRSMTLLLKLYNFGKFDLQTFLFADVCHFRKIFCVPAKVDFLRTSFALHWISNSKWGQNVRRPEEISNLNASSTLIRPEFWLFQFRSRPFKTQPLFSASDF